MSKHCEEFFVENRIEHNVDEKTRTVANHHNSNTRREYDLFLIMTQIQVGRQEPYDKGQATKKRGYGECN